MREDRLSVLFFVCVNNVIKELQCLGNIDFLSTAALFIFFNILSWLLNEFELTHYGRNDILKSLIYYKKS